MTMDIRALGYVRFHAIDLDAWRTFAVDGLGMEAVDGPNPDSLYLRVDDRAARIVIEPGPEDRLACAGWEVASPAALRATAEELEARGVVVKEASRDEIADRRVEAMVHCEDPSGNHLELFAGAVLDHRPLRNATNTRFVTDGMGLGHVVLPSPDMDATVAFYTDVLGFQLRDSMRLHYSLFPGRTEEEGPGFMRFLGCNPRHHSLGLFPAPIPGGIVHLMVEVATLDDVGRALDRIGKLGSTVSATLGRHTNDHMVSFYVRGPGGFDIEYGTGARLVDSATWVATEITEVSFWGHRFGGGKG
jgi:3,4-dihydroxy-9,10-secoandrosta-1,3,5(10)-triene-9,17-dione 4,5-dioxygenase